jgi:hypothetical protein
MKEHGREEGLLVRAEPFEWAEEISQRMVDVVRIVDGALLLEVDPQWAGAINTVLVTKGVRVNELSQVEHGRAAKSLEPRSVHMKDDEERADLKW